MLGRLRRFLSTETERAVADLPNASELLPPPPYVTSEFNAILDRIKSGEQLRSSELLPYLSCPLKAHRQEVNFRLAEVYTAAGQLEQAKVFVQRSWILSNFADEVLPLYLNIHETLKDAKAIREAYKRIGLKKIDENVSPAIYYFGMSQYADSHHHCVDMFEYDFDMLDAIEKAAKRFHLQVKATATEAEPTSKVRVGYLVKGITDVNSIIVRHIMTLTKYRDQSNFEVSIFCPEAQAKVFSSEQGAANVEELQRLGAKVYMAPDANDPDIAEMLLETAKQIRKAGIDVLVTSAGLCDFSHYFIVCLKAAKVAVGLVQGPPQQFAPPNLDWCISWSPHPQIDTPVNCQQIHFCSEATVTKPTTTVTRKEFDLPDDACILVSSGRAAKFQHPEHWSAMKDILEKFPNTYYVLIGSVAEYIQCLDDVIPDNLKPKIKFLGWRADVLSILPIADILIDTYPSGGGQSQVEAMLCGLPVVAHRNDYFAAFDQNNWSPIEDFVGDLESIVERGDFHAFKAMTARLIEDKDYREKLSKECLRRVQISAASDTLHQSVFECENVYLKALGVVRQPTS